MSAPDIKGTGGGEKEGSRETRWASHLMISGIASLHSGASYTEEKTVIELPNLT